MDKITLNTYVNQLSKSLIDLIMNRIELSLMYDYSNKDTQKAKEIAYNLPLRDLEDAFSVSEILNIKNL